MSRTSDKQLIEQLLRDLESRRGWRVERPGKGRTHTVIYAPDGRTRIVVGGTPSDHRWKLNLRAGLRRAGWHGTVLD